MNEFQMLKKDNNQSYMKRYLKNFFTLVNWKIKKLGINSISKEEDEIILEIYTYAIDQNYDIEKKIGKLIEQYEDLLETQDNDKN